MTPTLTIEDQIKFKRDIDSLDDILKSCLEFYKFNLTAFNGQQLDDYSFYYLDILVRFRLNVESLINLLPSFFNDYRLKISINLLLRSICSDVLTGLYLITFHDKVNDKDLISLKNELAIISSDSLKSMRQSIKEEHELLNTMNVTPSLSIETKIQSFNDIAVNVLNEQGEFKSRSEIRSSSIPELIEGLNISGAFLSENEKNRRIKEKGFKHLGFAFVAFKYYSQYQHYTLISKKLVELAPFHDTYYMTLTIDHMIMTTDIILQITGTPNQNFREEIKLIRDNIAKHFA